MAFALLRQLLGGLLLAGHLVQGGARFLQRGREAVGAPLLDGQLLHDALQFRVQVTVLPLHLLDLKRLLLVQSHQVVISSVCRIKAAFQLRDGGLQVLLDALGLRFYALLGGCQLLL